LIHYQSQCYTLGFEGAVSHMGRDLMHESSLVDTGHWQSVENTPMSVSKELTNAVLSLPIPSDKDELVMKVVPNMPWAEDHFQERVSRVPYNPPPSYEWWPFNKRGEQFQRDKKFSHTYPERFWPKMAWGSGGQAGRKPNRGIRYPYGDLDDLIDLLVKYPRTRQAWLPVWFPEDTGAVHGERVPCSLGYHFTLRNGKLDCHYVIRSCDFLRHFRDDVYMAARLVQWVLQELRDKQVHVDEETLLDWDEVTPGTLTMTMFSLHVFAGDKPYMDANYGERV
jgi:hypothetical protein